MRKMAVTEARRRFGQLLQLAQTEPVTIQMNGRDVAVVVSPEAYLRLTKGAPVPGVRPRIEQLLQESIERHRSVYEALAKLD